jgi:hypothetical protein
MLTFYFARIATSISETTNFNRVNLAEPMKPTCSMVMWGDRGAQPQH